MNRLQIKTFLVFLMLVSLLLVVTSSATAAPAYGPSDAVVHVVEPGETLFSIARAYGVSPYDIARANTLVNPNQLYPGQPLVIPGGGGYMTPMYGSGGVQKYVVQPGDTLFSIAMRFGTTVEALAAANGIGSNYLIFAGQTLVIPDGYPMDGKPPMYAAKTTTEIYPVVVKKAPVHGYHKAYGPPPKPAPYHPYPAHKPADKDKGTTEAKFLLQAPKGLVPALIKQVTDLKPATCNANTQITFPRNGEVLNGLGTFFITGTASIDDFQFYKLELGIGEKPIEFWSIDEVQKKPVVNGILLDGWNTGALPAGTYTLRLTVVDNRGQFPAPCDVIVQIKH